MEFFRGEEKRKHPTEKVQRTDPICNQQPLNNTKGASRRHGNRQINTDMVQKIFDLISSPQKDRGRIVLQILMIIVTSLFTIMIYSLIFGKEGVQPILTPKELVDFIVKGSFIKPLILFLLTWHLFYSVLDFILTRIIISISNKFAYAMSFWSVNQDKVNSHRVLSPILKLLGNTMLKTSFLTEVNGKVLAGYSFKQYRNQLKKVDEGKSELNILTLIRYLIILAQIISLMWIFDFQNGNVTITFNVAVTILAIIIWLALLLATGFAYFLKTYAEPIHSKMLEFEEKSKKTLLELEQKAKDNPELKTKEEVELNSEEELELNSKEPLKVNQEQAISENNPNL